MTELGYLQEKIFFLHNPKAGGSSLRAMLSGLFEEGQRSPVFGNSPNEYRNCRAELRNFSGFDFYAGHWGYEVYEALQDSHGLVTNFRDPVKRIYSLYRYWKYNVRLSDISGLDERDFAAVRAAHDLSFSEFIRSDIQEISIYIENFHARQLYWDGWSAFELNEGSLNTLKDRIERMDWFYIAESPDSSMFLFKKAFPQAVHLAIGEENRSAGISEKIPDADIDHLIRLNFWDYEIYAHAWRVQVERIRASIF